MIQLKGVICFIQQDVPLLNADVLLDEMASALVSASQVEYAGIILGIKKESGIIPE